MGRKVGFWYWSRALSLIPHGLMGCEVWIWIMDGRDWEYWETNFYLCASGVCLWMKWAGGLSPNLERVLGKWEKFSWKYLWNGFESQRVPTFDFVITLRFPFFPKDLERFRRPSGSTPYVTPRNYFFPKFISQSPLLHYRRSPFKKLTIATFISIHSNLKRSRAIQIQKETMNTCYNRKCIINSSML